MATTFEWFIDAEVDADYAAQAAEAAFAEVAKLEDELSRFRHTSDVWRLGLLESGQSLRVCLSVWDCLHLAKQVWSETAGAFDVTIGPLMNLWRDYPGLNFDPENEPVKGLRQRVGSHLFELNSEELSVTLRASGMIFDLGAVGKGYALDQVASLLQDWGISRALLNAGDSTLLALDAPLSSEGWLVTLGGGKLERSLRQRALSGSGFQVKGAHLMDPRTCKPLPVLEQRSFALAGSAALSDALSTAFMVMSESEIAELCGRYAGDIESLRV